MNAVDLQKTLQTALAHHQAGRIAEAERLYRAVLAVVPEQPVAVHHLGVIALQCGKPELAVNLIRRAVQLQPSAAALNNLGEAWRALGRLQEAIDCYTKAIKTSDGDANAHANLGLALTALKRLPEAETAFRQSLARAPNNATALIGLANLLTSLERHDDAVTTWERAAAALPQDLNVQRSLAMAWVDAGDPYRAISVIDRAIELGPSDGYSYGVLSRALEKSNKIEQAIAAARKATELSPDTWQAHQNLGSLLERVGQSAQAISPLEKAIQLNPREAALFAMIASLQLKEGYAQKAIQAALDGLTIQPPDARLYTALSAARLAMGEFDAAAEAARRAVSLTPHEVTPHGCLAFALLAAGKFEDGFKEYEWRWRDPKSNSKPRDFEQPLWDGSDLSGRRILVHSEQGYGDIFQFLRYVPLVCQRGASVIVEVNYKLAGLVRRLAANVSVCVAGTMLPAFDLHVPMASLPTIFRTTSRTIPDTVPYLVADRALAAHWRQKMNPGDDLLVGLVWAGNPKPDPRRSATLLEMVPLGTVPGVSLIALQPPPEGDQASAPPAGMKLLNLGPELRDFSDTTASVLANLDLLITVDTGVAHLAGAMGIPTWILLRESPEWRWMLSETTSPWYPTVRLFRQPSRGDWESVMKEVAEQLRDLVERRRSHSATE